MKYFSLISGKEVHPAPGTKVIPAKEFSTLISASELLPMVQREADEYRKEVVEESEKIKAAAFQEGFQEGLTSLMQHIHALDVELKKIRSEIQEKIVPLSMQAGRKILGDELKLHKERVVDIVVNALKPVTQHRKIMIYVNKADLEELEKQKPRIKQLFEHLENLSLQERADIEPGGCMIETEAGIINAQLEQMWRSLESAFESLMRK
jgi:type III secretion protein L